MQEAREPGPSRGELASGRRHPRLSKEAGAGVGAEIKERRNEGVGSSRSSLPGYSSAHKPAKHAVACPLPCPYHVTQLPDHERCLSLSSGFAVPSLLAWCEGISNGVATASVHVTGRGPTRKCLLYGHLHPSLRHPTSKAASLMLPACLDVCLQDLLATVQAERHRILENPDAELVDKLRLIRAGLYRRWARGKDPDCHTRPHKTLDRPFLMSSECVA